MCLTNIHTSNVIYVNTKNLARIETWQICNLHYVTSIGQKNSWVPLTSNELLNLWPSINQSHDLTSELQETWGKLGHILVYLPTLSETNVWDFHLHITRNFRLFPRMFWLFPKDTKDSRRCSDFFRMLPKIFENVLTISRKVGFDDFLIPKALNKH